MSTHTEFGQAADALYTVHAAQSCELEYDLDEPIAEGYVLGLFNSNGDGLALHGTRREILDYLALVTAHVQRETDPRTELDQALRRLHTLRRDRADALDAGDHRTAARLDEDELAVLADVAEAAEIVNDQL